MNLLDRELMYLLVESHLCNSLKLLIVAVILLLGMENGYTQPLFKQTRLSISEVDGLSPSRPHLNHSTHVASSQTAQGGASMDDENRLSETRLTGKTLKSIEITGIDNEKQLKNARIFLTLEKVKGEKIDRPSYVHYLIGQGVQEIALSQQPFGYYNVKVALHEQVEGEALTVSYQVSLNRPVHLDKVDVQVSGEAKDDKKFVALLRDNPLHKGEQLNHPMYEQYKAAFETLAAAQGYFDADFTRSVVFVNPETDLANIDLAFAGGTRFRFADVHFNQTPLDADLLRRFVQFKPGQFYFSRDVADLQQALQGSGYFKQVLVGNKPDTATKTVPIEVNLTMNKNKHYLLGLGYSTDEGPRAKLNFDWRWVNSHGHTFGTKAFISPHKYSLDNIYRIPAENPTTDYYYIRFGAKHENDAYKTTRTYLEGGYNYVNGPWTHRYGIVSAWEEFSIGRDHARTLLTYPQAHWVYSSNSNHIDPQSGYQVGFGLRGAAKGVMSDVSFVQGELQWRNIYPINDKNRLIGRANLGATWTEQFHRIPPSLRYFAGGDRSIRGYHYKQIGPYDASGANIGGKYFATGSIEYAYSFLPDWAAAVFVDAGDAFTYRFAPKVGAGVGIRWRSPVGPMAIDVAHGFHKPNTDAYRIHINIGTALDL